MFQNFENLTFLTSNGVIVPVFWMLLGREICWHQRSVGREGGEETARHKSGFKTFCRLPQRSRKKIYGRPGTIRGDKWERSRLNKKMQGVVAKVWLKSHLRQVWSVLALISIFKTTSNKLPFEPPLWRVFSNFCLSFIGKFKMANNSCLKKLTNWNYCFKDASAFKK